MATQTTDLELRIRTALEGVQQLVGFGNEVKDVGAAAATASEGARKLDDALESLAQLQEQIQRFRDLRNQVSEQSAALDAAREKQRQLTAEIAASLGPTQQQLTAHGKANAEVVKLEAQLGKARDRQREYTQQVIAADAPSAALLARQEASTRKLEALERALGVAKQRQADANAAVAAGSEPSEKLARKHEEATRTLEGLSAEVAHAKQQLDAEARALEAAGVSTAQLDQATERISQTFSDVATKARAFADAQAKLSFVPHEQLEREAAALRSSYDTLRASGKLSAQELAQANLKLQEGLLDLERRTNGWKDSLVKARLEIGTAIAAFAPIAYSIKQASDFETALADVRKVVDGTDEQFEQLTGRIRELSRELPISANGLAEIAAAGGQLGVPIDKLDQFIKLAAQVSVAFNVTAEEAGQAVAKLGNIFDIPLAKVGELASSINVLGNTTAATEGQILDFLTRVGGSARQFGLTAESVAALGASLIAMGRTPEVAATAVNALLVRLQAANVLAPKAQEALSGIGLSAEELARQIRENPQAALETFLSTLEQLDRQARTEAIAQILGVEQADKIASLVGNIEQYREALKNATDQQKVSGALQKEFDAQAETARQQYQLLKNVLADITLQLGTAFLPAVKAAIAAGKSVAEAIATVVDAAPGLTAVGVTLVSVGAAMSGLRIATAAARVAITGLLGSVGSLVPSLTAAGGAATAAATTVTGLGRALALVPRFVGVGIALAGAEAVISALIEIRNIQRELAASEAKAQAELQAGIDAARERLAQYSGQAAGAAAAIEAIAGGTEQLTDAQVQHYAGALAAADEYLKAQIAIGVREQELYGQTSINLAAVRDELARVRDAQAELQTASEQTAPVKLDQIIDPAILPALQDLDEQIGKLGDDALTRLKDQAQTAFNAVSQAIADVGAQFPALQGAALEAALAMDSRYAGLIETHRTLGSAVEQLRDEQYRRLGIDASEVLTGIDGKATALLATFRSLVSDPAADPRLLTAAFRELLKTLDSPQELEALKLSLAKVQIAGFDAAKAVAEIEKKLKDTQAAGDEAANAIAAAFAAFGIKTRAELEATAAKAREQYQLVQQSGQATADGLNTAFAKMAEAQLAAAAAAGAAAAEAAAGFLRAEAATDEQRAAVDRLIERYRVKADVAARAGDAAEAGSIQAVRALNQELSALDAVEAAYQRRTAARDGEAPYDPRAIRDQPTSGGTASAAALDDRYFDLTAEQRAEVDAQFRRLYEDLLRARRRRDGGLSSTGPLVPIEQVQLRQTVQDLITDLLRGQTQPQPGRTVDININLPGIGSARVSATPDQAQALEALLRELEQALPAGKAMPIPSPTPSRTVEVRLVVADQTYSLLGDEATAQALLDELARAKSVTY